MIDGYGLLVFGHILLMVYWLGGDLGVYIAAHYVTNPERPLEERLRFMKFLLELDQAPRIAMILMLPVGFQMGLMLGVIAMPGWVMAVMWPLALFWVFLTWQVHVKEGRPEGQRYDRIESLIRNLALPVILLLGVYALVTGQIVLVSWLAVKLLVFAGIMVCGLLLRRAIVPWIEGFRLLQENGPSDQANRMILRAHRWAKVEALTLWGLVALNGLLGVTKPF